MFKLSEIKELIKLVNQTSIHELEIENEGSRLCIRKPNHTQVQSGVFNQPNQNQNEPLPQAQPLTVNAPSANVKATEVNEQETASNLHTIASPMVGTFYASPSPSAPIFVKKGDKVKEKTVVCIVEAMKLMNEIEAEVKGEIVEILVDNGQLVEFGQPLFLVKI